MSILVRNWSEIISPRFMSIKTGGREKSGLKVVYHLAQSYELLGLPSITFKICIGN